MDSLQVGLISFFLIAPIVMVAASTLLIYVFRRKASVHSRYSELIPMIGILLLPLIWLDLVNTRLYLSITLNKTNLTQNDIPLIRSSEVVAKALGVRGCQFERIIRYFLEPLIVFIIIYRLWHLTGKVLLLAHERALSLAKAAKNNPNRSSKAANKKKQGVASTSESANPKSGNEENGSNAKLTANGSYVGTSSTNNSTWPYRITSEDSKTSTTKGDEKKVRRRSRRPAKDTVRLGKKYIFLVLLGTRGFISSFSKLLRDSVKFVLFLNNDNSAAEEEFGSSAVIAANGGSFREYYFGGLFFSHQHGNHTGSGIGTSRRSRSESATNEDDDFPTNMNGAISNNPVRTSNGTRFGTGNILNPKTSNRRRSSFLGFEVKFELPKSMGKGISSHTTTMAGDSVLNSAANSHGNSLINLQNIPILNNSAVSTNSSSPVGNNSNNAIIINNSSGNGMSSPNTNAGHQKFTLSTIASVDTLNQSQPDISGANVNNVNNISNLTNDITGNILMNMGETSSSSAKVPLEGIAEDERSELTSEEEEEGEDEEILYESNNVVDDNSVNNNNANNNLNISLNTNTVNNNRNAAGRRSVGANPVINSSGLGKNIATYEISDLRPAPVVNNEGKKQLEIDIPVTFNAPNSPHNIATTTPNNAPPNTSMSLNNATTNTSNTTNMTATTELLKKKAAQKAEQVKQREALMKLRRLVRLNMSEACALSIVVIFVSLILYIFEFISWNGTVNNNLFAAFLSCDCLFLAPLSVFKSVLSLSLFLLASSLLMQSRTDKLSYFFRKEALFSIFILIICLICPEVIYWAFVLAWVNNPPSSSQVAQSTSTDTSSLPKFYYDLPLVFDLSMMNFCFHFAILLFHCLIPVIVIGSGKFKKKQAPSDLNFFESTFKSNSLLNAFKERLLRENSLDEILFIESARKIYDLLDIPFNYTFLTIANNNVANNSGNNIDQQGPNNNNTNNNTLANSFLFEQLEEYTECPELVLKKLESLADLFIGHNCAMEVTIVRADRKEFLNWYKKLHDRVVYLGVNNTNALMQAHHPHHQFTSPQEGHAGMFGGRRASSSLGLGGGSPSRRISLRPHINSTGSGGLGNGPSSSVFLGSSFSNVMNANGNNGTVINVINNSSASASNSHSNSINNLSNSANNSNNVANLNVPVAGSRRGTVAGQSALNTGRNGSFSSTFSSYSNMAATGNVIYNSSISNSTNNHHSTQVPAPASGTTPVMTAANSPINYQTETIGYLLKRVLMSLENIKNGVLKNIFETSFQHFLEECQADEILKKKIMGGGGKFPSSSVVINGVNGGSSGSGSGVGGGVVGSTKGTAISNHPEEENTSKSFGKEGGFERNFISSLVGHGI